MPAARKAAAISRVLGYKLIENFNKPFISTSLRDFWRRWHISLSMCLRDYVYIPLGGSRNKRVFWNLVATFALCGLWHAPIAKYGVWGAVMGAMVFVNQRWVQWMEVVDAGDGWLARLRRASEGWKPLPQLLGWFVTAHVFLFSLLFFFGAEGALRVLWELATRPIEGLVGWFGGELDIPSLPADPNP